MRYILICPVCGSDEFEESDNGVFTCSDCHNILTSDDLCDNIVSEDSADE